MNRATALLAGLASTAVLAGCSPASPDLRVTGTVSDDLTTVTAPTLLAPKVNLDAGFSDLTGPYNPVTGRTTARTSAVAADFGLGSMVRIASVTITEGDTVRAGQVIGAVDTRLQKAQVEAAKADAQVGRAQVGLLADAIDTTFDKQADVKDARTKVVDAIAKVTKTRAKLVKALADIRKALPRLRAALAQVEAAIAQVPPGVPVLPELSEKRDSLRTGIAKAEAGAKKIKKALPKLATGLRKARSGLRKLEDAAAKITDARANLRDLHELAIIQAGALQVPIDAARVQVSSGKLVSPVDGVVVSAASSGDVLAAGATVVAIREAGPSTVTAWLSPAQLAQACPGDAATITGDWMSGDGVRATLTRIGTRADYPPTSVATDEVHLTRAVEVEFTATAQLPAGVPVEISIQPCQPAANNPNR